MDNVLATLLGSAAKAKLLRLFVSNPNSDFSMAELQSSTKLRKESIQKELRPLLKIKLLKQSECKREQKGNTKKTRMVKTKCFSLNPSFKDLRALRQFVLNIEPADDSEIAEKLKKAGKIKLLLVSGIFLQDDDARVDILLVADKIKEAQLKRAISEIEAHVGKELSYADMSSDEFKYRLSMYDKLLRDIFDGNYKIIIDKFKNSWQELSMS